MILSHCFPSSRHAASVVSLRSHSGAYRGNNEIGGTCGVITDLTGIILNDTRHGISGKHSNLGPYKHKRPKDKCRWFICVSFLCSIYQVSTLTLVHWTLEYHWNATGWPTVHWDTTGRPSDYLHGTSEHHWKNLVETAPLWDAIGETLTFAAYTGTPLEGL